MSAHTSRCAAAGESRVKAALPDRVPTAHPCQETLEAETIAAMRRRSVSRYKVSIIFGRQRVLNKKKERKGKS